MTKIARRLRRGRLTQVGGGLTALPLSGNGDDLVLRVRPMLGEQFGEVGEPPNLSRYHDQSLAHRVSAVPGFHHVFGV